MSQAKPEFKVAVADESAPKTVTKIGELRPMLVEYIDGRGEKSAQVALVSPTGNTVFLLNDLIQGQAVVKEASKWLVDALKKHAVEKKGVEQV